ncbi:MAG: serine/threonine protein kinase [Deltaproteobacteria bacterium]|nr:serine/threonine protein kinase [Deltaproteobacteria bacterium]
MSDPRAPKRPMGTPPPLDAAARLEHERLRLELRARLFKEPRAAVHVGGYELLHPLGQGGSGSVFAVRRTEDGRSLALKLVDPGMPRAVERLRREGRAMAALTHPHIVEVHEVGEHEDGAYLVMDRIDGISVRQWLESPRPWARVLDLLLPVADGLAAAHDQGILHRDIKPENIVVDARDHAWLLDFGLAKPLPDSVVETTSAFRQPLTQAGAVLGTVGYVAPEHLLGDPVDARSDQFSLCTVLYEALLGQAPFAGKTAEEAGLAVLRGQIRPPPPERAVPRAVLDPVLRGLDSDPARRHASVAALREALVRTTRPPETSGRLRRWWKSLRERR